MTPINNGYDFSRLIKFDILSKVIDLANRGHSGWPARQREV